MLKSTSQDRAASLSSGKLITEFLAYEVGLRKDLIVLLRLTFSESAQIHENFMQD